MKEITEIINESNEYYNNRLLEVIQNGGITHEQYVGYLRMQYHLTKGVQKPFLSIAAHEKTRPYKKLRDFLVRFAYEEEMHFRLAEKDLQKLNEKTGDIPLDVTLWWSYYNQAIVENPFVRLGSTCILENIGKGTHNTIKLLMSKASFLNNQNTTFLRVHMHEELPHGDQVVEALRTAKLKDADYADLVKGTKIGFVLYSRMIHWALTGKEII